MTRSPEGIQCAASAAIVRVAPGTPAAKAGILPGMRVQAINGDPVKPTDTAHAVCSLLASASERVQLTVNFGGLRSLAEQKAAIRQAQALAARRHREMMDQLTCHFACLFCCCVIPQLWQRASTSGGRSRRTCVLLGVGLFLLFAMWSVPIVTSEAFHVVYERSSNSSLTSRTSWMPCLRWVLSAPEYLSHGDHSPAEYAALAALIAAPPSIVCCWCVGGLLLRQVHAHLVHREPDAWQRASRDAAAGAPHLHRWLGPFACCCCFAAAALTGLGVTRATRGYYPCLPLPHHGDSTARQTARVGPSPDGSAAHQQQPDRHAGLPSPPAPSVV